MAETHHEGLEGLSVRGLVHMVSAGRREVALWMVAAALLWVVVGGALYIVSPVERSAGVGFRINFAGAERDQYPNGAPFSRGDLLAPNVLTRVFALNELERYFTFEDFRSALSILEVNNDRMMIEYEYASKLSDTRLPPVERTRIEHEFRQRVEAMPGHSAQLTFTSSSRLRMPPDDLMQKVLSDVLVTWADDVATKRGALRHQVELLTPNVIINDTLNSQTMLIRYDLLRRHVGRIRGQVTRLSALPGGSTVRVGTAGVTLLDLGTSLDDLMEFQFNPLIRRRLVYAPSAGGAVDANRLYLEDRIAELQRELENVEKRRSQLQMALQTFSVEGRSGGSSGTAGDPATVAPQLSDSFLDRLMELAGRSDVMDYRKALTDRILDAGNEVIRVQQDLAFYDETLRLLRSGATRGSAASAASETLEAAFERLQARVLEILKQTVEAYESISTSNLNPRSELYSLTHGFSVRTSRAITLGFLFTLGVWLIVAAAILGTVVGVVRVILRRNHTVVVA